MDDLYLDECIESGSDAGRGNLLGIQPYLSPEDYRSEETLAARLGSYFAAARERGWLNKATVAVLPEYTGAWLVAAGEQPAVYGAPSVAAAMRPLALAHPFSFLASLVGSKAQDRQAAAIFHLKGKQTARIYQEVFSFLSGGFGVTLVAGSVILPQPRILDGALLAGRGPLQNVSTVFRPNGSLYPELVRKAYPIASELPFLSPAPLSGQPIFQTPAGRLGVLICADSWYPEPYRLLSEKRVELLAVPSFLSGDGIWEQPWRGYDCAAAPADVDPADAAGQISEGQAWRKYALAGRIESSGARAGINVFLHGKLWDLGSDSGRTLGLGPDGQIETSSRRAALVNCWL